MIRTQQQQPSSSRPGHVEELSSQGTFHIQVQGAGAVQTGGDVDLQQPGLQLRVQEDVEAKEFKTGISAGNIVVMQTGQARLCTKDSLDHQVFNLLPDIGVIDPRSIEVSPQCFQCPFVALKENHPYLSISTINGFGREGLTLYRRRKKYGSFQTSLKFLFHIVFFFCSL